MHQSPGAAPAAVVGDGGEEKVRIIERVGVRLSNLRLALPH